MRILDADALLKMINSKKGMIGCTGLRNYINFMAKDDKDIVEVVRCKDCRYKPVGTGCNHDLEFPVHYKCPCECDDYWYSWMPKDDFFCGNGERRTNATD